MRHRTNLVVVEGVKMTRFGGRVGYARQFEQLRAIFKGENPAEVVVGVPHEALTAPSEVVVELVQHEAGGPGSCGAERSLHEGLERVGWAGALYTFDELAGSSHLEAHPAQDVECLLGELDCACVGRGAVVDAIRVAEGEPIVGVAGDDEGAVVNG